MMDVLNQGTAADAVAANGHPGINRKGDPWIIAQLEEVRWRNRNGTNPNLTRPRMVMDFKAGRIRTEEAST